MMKRRSDSNKPVVPGTRAKRREGEGTITHVSGSCGNIEDAFAQYRRGYRAFLPSDLNGTLFHLRLEASRARERRLAHAVLNTQRRGKLLSRAVSHLTDVDLDSAWKAALRGDRDTVEARVLPHVDPRPSKRRRKGSPWRASGWLRPEVPKRLGGSRSDRTVEG